MANNLNQRASIPSDTATGTGTSGAGQAVPQRYYTLPFTTEEINMANEIKTASVDNLRSGSYSARQYLNFAGAIDDEPDGKGVTNISNDILIIAIRIAKRIGKELYVNCGYRSPETNAALYAADPRNVARTSLHLSGLAMDISMTRSGLDTVAGRERFIQIASQEGVGGIGTYNTFIHIDTGNRRRWTSAGREEYKHTNALTLHSEDKFRNGVPETPPINESSDVATPVESDQTETTPVNQPETTPANRQETILDRLNAQPIPESATTRWAQNTGVGATSGTSTTTTTVSGGGSTIVRRSDFEE
jgi:uncharacterized protein YcbK (DUF882 family)